MRGDYNEKNTVNSQDQNPKLQCFVKPIHHWFPGSDCLACGVHALQRKLVATNFSDVRFTAVGVVCHQMDLQTYRGEGDYVHSIIGTGNPLVPKTKKGDHQNAERPPFVEEARCHVTVSLLIECENIQSDFDEFTETVDDVIQSKMKLAGGDILSASHAKLTKINSEEDHRLLMRQVMPGYCLVERRKLMQHAMADGMDAIDALLEYLKVTHSSIESTDGKVKWESKRKEKGWIVPIAVGFHGISEIGRAQNQRAPETPHRFAESIVTLGEFIMPYRIEKLDNMLWHYQYEPENKLYLCKQNTPINEM